MNEEKIARICWNTNKWQKPSGRDGKVANSKSDAYEVKTGYGHEEWLLDTSKLIDGHHYAHIQAIGQHRDKYVGSSYNISFYTINSKTKERWWLGEIHNVQVISEGEAEIVYETYKKNEWLREMNAQLDSVGADVHEFMHMQPAAFCCIKFKLQDMKILDEPMLFSADDPAIKSDYYNLKNKVSGPIILNAKGFNFIPGNTSKKSSATAQYQSQNRDIDLVHNQIQGAIYEELIKLHGVTNVGCEQTTGFGTKIDIVVKHGNDFFFYELKTANTAKQCIREALSQLLEYAYYPSEKLAKKLVVLSTVELSDDARKYLKNIRKLFNIPIFYQQFNQENKILGLEE